MWFEKLKNKIKDFFYGFDEEGLFLMIFMILMVVIVVGSLVALIVSMSI